MVVVLLQPGREFLVARGMAGAQQALGADIAHQGLVLEPGDVGIGLGELAGRLRLEDAPVGLAGVGIEHRGQVGHDGDLVELDHRGRRPKTGRRGTMVG